MLEVEGLPGTATGESESTVLDSNPTSARTLKTLELGFLGALGVRGFRDSSLGQNPFGNFGVSEGDKRGRPLASREAMDEVQAETFLNLLDSSEKRFFLFSINKKTNLYLFFTTIDLLFVVCLTRPSKSSWGPEDLIRRLTHSNIHNSELNPIFFIMF